LLKVLFSLSAFLVLSFSFLSLSFHLFMFIYIVLSFSLTLTHTQSHTLYLSFYLFLFSFIIIFFLPVCISAFLYLTLSFYYVHLSLSFSISHSFFNTFLSFSLYLCLKGNTPNCKKVEESISLWAFSTRSQIRTYTFYCLNSLGSLNRLFYFVSKSRFWVNSSLQLELVCIFFGHFKN